MRYPTIWTISTTNWWKVENSELTKVVEEKLKMITDKVEGKVRQIVTEIPQVSDYNHHNSSQSELEISNNRPPT